MHLTKVYTTYCGLRKLPSTANILSWFWWNYQCLLNKSIKEFTSRFRCSSIKSKSEFIQIIIKVGWLYSALMSPLQPAFKQSCNPISQGQQIVTYIAAALAYYRMLITFRTQLCVSLPSICTYQAAFFYTFLDCWYKILCRGISYSSKANSSKMVIFVFYHNDNQTLAFGTTPPFPRLFPTDVSFVYFDCTRQSISSRSDHCTSQFVQPCPSCTITFKSQNSLQSQCANPIFLIDNIPDSSKPKHQWLSSIIEYRPSCDRGLSITNLTVVQSLFCDPCLCMTTFGTTKTVLPSNVGQVFQTGFFFFKSVFEFKDCRWVVFHTPILYIVPTLVKCITQLY